jgi:hypothetical protein
MNIKTLSPITLAALLASTVAYGAAHTSAATPAKGEGPPTGIPKPDDRKRANVKAEAAAATEAGEIKKGPAVAKPRKPDDNTRAEVRAEAASAVRAGEIGKGPNVPPSGIKK